MQLRPELEQAALAAWLRIPKAKTLEVIMTALGIGVLFLSFFRLEPSTLWGLSPIVGDAG